MALLFRRRFGSWVNHKTLPENDFHPIVFHLGRARVLKVEALFDLCNENEKHRSKHSTYIHTNTNIQS
jgi:hypothetical protein